jgi:hypothetical protein
VLLKGHIGNNSFAETAARSRRSAARFHRPPLLHLNFRMLGAAARISSGNRVRLSFPRI